MSLIYIRSIGARKVNTKRGLDWFGLFICSYCKSEIERSMTKRKRDQSCGCVKNTLISQKKTQHGDAIKVDGSSPARLYTIYRNMMNRCYNDNVLSYKYYGHRGIQVCKKWHSYIEFKKWAMKHGYTQYLTIDRINNDGNYCPDNCQWITLSANISKRHRTERRQKHDSI